MGFRFRKGVQLFPGVRLNFSRSGVSTTIGVPGAGVTIGPRGTYANVGLPGTGLSYRARLDRPVGRRRPSHPAHPSAPGWIELPGTEPRSPSDAPPRAGAPWLGAYERIGSASVEYLTSPGLQALRDLVNEVADRRRDLEREIAQLRTEIRWLRRLEGFYRLLLLRLLTFPLARSAERKRIAAEAERAELEEMLAVTGFELDFAIDDVVAREFGGLERAYQRVRRSAQIWDVTGRAAIEDRVRARTIARQSIEREPVGLDLAQAPFVHSRWQALRFGNVNGEDLYLYPGFVMVQSPEGSFALLEIDQVDLENYPVRFHEDERLPADAQVVGHTWLKANKDNTPDRRFRDNRQIPVALYGWLEFRSGGLHEAYMVSDAEAAAAFAAAFERYRRVLAKFAKRGGSITHEASARDAEHGMITGEDAEPPADVAKLARRRFGLGFPVTDLALAAILARVVIGGWPLEAPVQTGPAATVSETPAQTEPAAGLPIPPDQAEPAAGGFRAPVQAERSALITDSRVQTESEQYRAGEELRDGPPVATYGPEWSQWELENAVAKERDWLVIRQPGEGFCYLKQSYSNDLSKMEMIVGRSGVSTIITPWQIQSNIRYQVDDSALREIPTSQIDDANAIKLSRDFVPALKAGRRLTISLSPIGESRQTQTFSLLGFTAASRWLEREECEFNVSKEAMGEDGGTALDVRLERIAGGKVHIVGQTSLPDEMELMLDLVNLSADYFAQDKVVVSAGAFRSAAFSDRGAALPAGTYQVLVSSPLPRLQPASVRSAVGENGELLSGPAVVQEDGKRRIHWTVLRQLQ